MLSVRGAWRLSHPSIVQFPLGTCFCIHTCQWNNCNTHQVWMNKRTICKYETSCLIQTPVCSHIGQGCFEYRIIMQGAVLWVYEYSVEQTEKLWMWFITFLNSTGVKLIMLVISLCWLQYIQSVYIFLSERNEYWVD